MPKRTGSTPAKQRETCGRTKPDENVEFMRRHPFWYVVTRLLQIVLYPGLLWLAAESPVAAALLKLIPGMSE